MIVFANIITLIVSVLFISKVRHSDLSTTFLSLLIFDLLFVFPLLAETILGVASTSYLGFQYAQYDVGTGVLYALFCIIVEGIFVLNIKKEAARAESDLSLTKRLTTLRSQINKNQVLLMVAGVACVLPIMCILFSPDPFLYFTQIGYFSSVGSYGNAEVQPDSIAFNNAIKNVQYLAIIGAVLLKLGDINNKSSLFCIRVIAIIGVALINSKRTLVTLLLLVLLAITMLSNDSKKRKWVTALITLTVAGTYFIAYSYLSEKYYLNTDWYAVISEYFFKSTSVKVSIFSILHPDSLRILDYPGQTVLFDLLFFIPRAVWHSKPYPFPDYYSSAVKGYSGDSWNFQTNIYSEWIANFGILGFILAPLVLILLIRMAENSRSTICLISGICFVIMIETFEFSDVAKILLIIFVVSYIGEKLLRPQASKDMLPLFKEYQQSMNKNKQVSNLEMALEHANADYLALLHSDEYAAGRRLIKLKRLVKGCHFATIIKDFSKRSRARSANARTRTTQTVASAETLSPIRNDESVCVYSCVTNSYDHISEPYYDPGSYEGLLFSDEECDSAFWKHCSLDFSNQELAKNPNRFIKLHPFGFSKNYDFAIYVDGSVVLVSDISQFAEAAKSAPAGFAIHQHPFRDCLYDEGTYCIASGRGNASQIKAQLAHYEAEGMPHHFGLFEATVFAVDLHNEVARSIFENWWDELCRSGSGRDQLALPYVLWKLGVSVSSVGVLGTDVSLNPKLRVLKHSTHAWQQSTVK